LFIELGRKAITENNFKIYPNPARTEFTIELSSDNLYFHFSIFDLNGKEVMRDEINQLRTTFSTANLNEGIYFIRLVNGKEIFNKKMLIIK
jgi:hypothetical protein